MTLRDGRLRRSAHVARLGAAALALFTLALAGCSDPATPTATSASAVPSPSVSVASLGSGPLDEQLFEAVRAGDIELARLALEAGQSPDFIMRDVTPLAVACGRDDLDMAILLIDAGATVVSDRGDHIYTAVRTAGPEVIALLLEHGSSPTGPAGDEGAVLAEAAFAGNVPAMRALIEAGAPVDGPILRGGRTYTPIFPAAYGGSVEAVEYLITVGADPYAEATDGSTPSEWADIAGHPAVVEFLADMGA